MKKLLFTFSFCFFLLNSFSQIANQPSPLELCDVNNPGDEQEQFTLEDANAEILNGQTGISLTYYETQSDADNATNPIESPYINTSNPQTLFVRAEDDITGNYDATALTIRVLPLPTPSIQIPNLELCDENNDGFSLFDLTSNELLILNGEIDVILSYYDTIEGASNNFNPIPNPSNYLNIVPFQQSIYGRVEIASTGCYVIISFDLIVNPLPILIQPTPLVLCDDGIPDGLTTFDLSIKNSEIIGGNSNYSVSYYVSQSDGDAGTNALPTFYANTTNPQTVFVRVEDVNTGCYNTTTLNLVVEQSPVANTPQPLSYCDLDNDGFGTFNLTDVDDEITGGNPELAVSYHETFANANNNINPIDTALDYNNIIENIQTLYVRVENATVPLDCVTLVELQLVVESTPQIAQPSALVVCEDDSIDGFTTFDLTTKANEILNGLNPSQYIVSYYESEVDAQASNNAIANPTNYANTAQSMQILWVRVEDINTVEACYGLTSMELIVTGQNCGPDSGILMQNGIFTACGGTFFDSGGEFGNYAENEDYTITICPENEGDALGLNFTSFTTQLVPDILSIYDGDSTNADLIGSFSGLTSPGLVVASADNTSGCLTITFVSNATGNTVGWEADIICYQPCEEFTSSINVTSHNVSSSGVYIVGIGEIISLEANTINSEATFIYNWDFGDGNMADGANATYQFMDEGTFNVALNTTIEGANDCIETETITVVVLDENVVVYPTDFTVEELISDVFLGGQCSQIFNVTYSTGVTFNANEPNGISYFASTGDTFPFSEGLILTTGNAANAGGPNNATILSEGSGSWPGDTDLDNVIPGLQSNNATFIEFDFIPLINEISFDFLMASEEYDAGNFECQFSDAFAFLLTDAQGNTTNLAVIPNTDTPILVTNVHPDNGSCGAINEEYFGGYVSEGSPPIAFDGMTTELRAQSQVNIGESYHIKLVIADDRDNLFDSGVFLRAGSLDIGELCNDIGLINAKAFKDDNSNGILDPNELDFTQGFFTYEKNNDGVINNVNTNIGNFSIVSDNESDIYEITFNIYDEYNNCFMPITSTVIDISVLNGNVTTINFPIENDQACEDLAVYLLNPFEAPRPGFDYTNQLIIENLSNSVISSGSIEVNFDDSISFNEIVDLNPDYSFALTASGFTLDFINLEIGATEIIDISLNCDVTAILDEIVTNTATYITDENDLFSTNNTSELAEVVIGSYDPNDIYESHGPEIIHENFITTDEYLYYTIRFQNVGTAEAIFVRIEDELDAQLDENTFQMLRSSHYYTVTRTESSLEWFFDDINLPAEQDDAEGSNGYVHFKIKPKSDYSVGDVIPNSSAIYFDFNSPVITNTFITTFVEPLSVKDFNSNIFSVYPNPAKDKVTISLKENSVDDFDITLIDIQGKVINIAPERENGSFVFDVSFLESGLYFIQLRNDNGDHIEKLIKE